MFNKNYLSLIIIHLIIGLINFYKKYFLNWYKHRHQPYKNWNGHHAKFFISISIECKKHDAIYS